MAFLFRNKQRNNQDLCRSTRELLLKLSGGSDPKMHLRIEEELAKNLSQMKLVLQGTTEQDPVFEQMYQLVGCLTTEDVLPHLALNMRRLPFESRKDAVAVFCHVIRFKLPQHDLPFALNYLAEQRPDIVVTLCHGYDHKDSARPCGQILREALKLDAIAAIILYDEPLPEGQKMNLRTVDSTAPSSGKGIFWRFFDWIDTSIFEVGTDAFTTFKEIFDKHKKLTAHYLQTNLEMFVSRYNGILIDSNSYVTKRQSLNLLAQLLLERCNYNLMTRYIESADNLKLVMQQLKDDRRMVNYEAFHVFKIFIANPHKSVPVQRILINNKDKLLKFLPAFLPDKDEDVQFADEKAYCIRMIRDLPAQPVDPQLAASAVAGGGSSSSSGKAQGQNGRHGALVA